MTKKRRSSSRSSGKMLSSHRKHELERFWKKHGMMVLGLIAAVILGLLILKFISK